LVRKNELSNIDDFTGNRLKCTSPEARNETPGLFFQPSNSELAIRCLEYPILWGHKCVAGLLSDKSRQTMNKAYSEVVSRLAVLYVTVFAQPFAHFSPEKVWNIRDDQRVFSGEEFGRFHHASSSYGAFVGLIVGVFGCERGSKVGLERFIVGGDQVAGKLAGVDQRAERRGL
jgi:hypothetical protein